MSNSSDCSYLGELRNNLRDHRKRRLVAVDVQDLVEEHLEQHDARRPQVGLGRVLLIPVDLGRDVSTPGNQYVIRIRKIDPCFWDL